MDTDIFTQKLEDFLITQPQIDWELEKEDYQFLIEHHKKILLLITVSSVFSLFDSFSSIIEISQATINHTIAEIGLSVQDLLIENIEKEFR
jgi:hypothetical protein